MSGGATTLMVTERLQGKTGSGAPHFLLSHPAYLAPNSGAHQQGGNLVHRNTLTAFSKNKERLNNVFPEQA